MDYPGLQTSAAAFLNRADLYGMIPTFVVLAEAEIGRRLRHRRMIGRATASVASEFETVPGDFATLISMTLEGTDEVLDGLSPDALNERKARESVTSGKPDSYAVVGGSFQFFPAPSQAYSVDISYYAQVPALSIALPTNWLLTQFPDLYLYGLLKHAAPYLGEDARLPVWSGLFEGALESAALDSVRAAYGARVTPRTSLVV